VGAETANDTPGGEAPNHGLGGEAAKDTARRDAPVLTDRRDGVLLITLNRPDARNAVNLPLAEALSNALDELDGEPSIAVGVLTGAGRGFCAGMDLKAFVTGERPWAGDRGFAGITRRGPAKPLIAAVEGFALAGGLEVALSCDLIVAAEDARLGLPEVRRGLVAAGGGLLRLPRRIPYHVAMELALTGAPIDARRGAQLGLVNRVSPPGEALEVALELASAVAEGGPLSLIASKRIIEEQQDWTIAEMWERQDAICAPIFVSEDAKEGAKAFAEKRPPEWRGR
jgi:enoyl-CoA hydratase/carnithine racemase